jgi:hypothetical protein
MQALSWALGLRDLEPTVKLLAIYLCNGLLTARYRDVDVDMAADFCGVAPGTILKLAKQLPKKISFTHEKGSRRIRFDMGQERPRSGASVRDLERELMAARRTQDTVGRAKRLQGWGTSSFPQAPLSCSQVLV